MKGGGDAFANCIMSDRLRPGGVRNRPDPASVYGDQFEFGIRISFKHGESRSKFPVEMFDAIHAHHMQLTGGDMLRRTSIALRHFALIDVILINVDILINAGWNGHTHLPFGRSEIRLLLEQGFGQTTLTQS